MRSFKIIQHSIESIGDKTINFFISIFDALRIALTLILYLLFPTSYRAQMRETLTKQIYFTALQPLVLFLFLAFLFGTSILGAVISLATQYNLQDKIGLIIIKFSINEYAPFFTALFISLYSGARINAALLLKKEAKELDTSLEALVHLLAPRVLGGIISALVLGTLVSVLVITSGYVFTLFYLHMQIDAYTFMLSNALDIRDLKVFLIKSVLFGFLSMFLPVYLALKSKTKPHFLSHALLKNMLKLLLILLFLEVLSFFIQ
jgi:phospholipid/cholesterol/gamma-HCH transport system permease protein